MSSENSAFMPAAGGPAVAACFGASLIRLPRPPAGMGGGGAGPPRFAAAGAEAGSGFAAPGQRKRWRKAAFTAQDICIWQGQTPGDPCAFSSGGATQGKLGAPDWARPPQGRASIVPWIKMWMGGICPAASAVFAVLCKAQTLTRPHSSRGSGTHGAPAVGSQRVCRAFT